jgi:hypothetical protein
MSFSTEIFGWRGAFFSTEKWVADHHNSPHITTFSPPKNHILTPTFSKTPPKIPAKQQKPRVTPGLNFFCSFSAFNPVR